MKQCSFKQNGFVMNSPFIVNALLLNDNGYTNDGTSIRRNYTQSNGIAKASIRPATQKYPQNSFSHGKAVKTSSFTIPSAAAIVIPSNTSQHEDDLSNIDVKSLVSYLLYGETLPPIQHFNKIRFN